MYPLDYRLYLRYNYNISLHKTEYHAVANYLAFIDSDMRYTMNINSFSPYIRVAMQSTLAAGYSVNERVIFDYELIMVTGGKCRITIDGTPYLCQKNDVVFIKPGIPHKFECFEDCNFVQPHLHFDLTYNDKSEKRFVSFKNKSAMTDEELSLISIDELADINIPYVFTPYDSKNFSKIFFEIIDIFQSRKRNFELLYKAKLLEMISVILYQFENGKANEQNSIKNTVVSVKNYIDNNYLSALSLDSLASQFFINKYTLLRNFRNLYKINIMAYYKEKRLEYAKTTLSGTSVSVQSIAEKMNFPDIYSFSRFFKTNTGYSPTTFRKEYL